MVRELLRLSAKKVTIKAQPADRFRKACVLFHVFSCRRCDRKKRDTNYFDLILLPSRVAEFTMAEMATFHHFLSLTSQSFSLPI